MSGHWKPGDVHLSYALGGCATAGHPGAVTDPAQVKRVTCPICRVALRVTSSAKTEADR